MHINKYYRLDNKYIQLNLLRLDLYEKKSLYKNIFL